MQNPEILAHLKLGKTITPREALDKFGSFRLAARIHDLKSEGWPIHCNRERVDSGAIVGVYYLDPDKTKWPE